MRTCMRENKNKSKIMESDKKNKKFEIKEILLTTNEDELNA